MDPAPDFWSRIEEVFGGKASQRAGVPLILLPAGCGVQTCGPSGKGDLSYPYLRANGGQPGKPSDFFCGKHAKKLEGEPCEADVCNGKAQKNFTVRGWIVNISGYDFNSPALPINLLVDREFFPQETRSRIANEIITPNNLIVFGESDFPGDWHVWGGQKSMVIHLEIGGWSERPQKYMGLHPSNWAAVEEAPNIYWAWHPQKTSDTQEPLEVGNYVEITGTLWEDWPHLSDLDGARGLDKTAEYLLRKNEIEIMRELWSLGESRGWMEIHPPDSIRKVPQPQPHERSAMIAIAAKANLSSSERRSVTYDLLLDDLPKTGNEVGYEEAIDWEFTDRESIRKNRVEVLPNGIRIHVSVESSWATGQPGRFKAFYRVFWK